MDQQPQINSGTDLGSIASTIADPTERSIVNRSEQDAKEVKDFGDKKIAELDKLTPAKPPVLTEGPKQENYQTDPMKTFGSSAGFLATFGSLLTRHPLLSALNAGASVMTAANNKDAASFKAAMDKWKLESENAFKMADWDLKQYENAISKGDTEVKIYSAAHKNETAGLALEAKMHEADLKNAKAQLSAAKESQKVVNDYLDLTDKKYIEEHPNATQLEIATNRMENFGKANMMKSGFLDKEEYKEKKRAEPSISPETAKFAADQILAGDKSALSNYGRGEKATANLAAIHEQVQQLAKAKGISGSDLARINAEFGGFQSEQKLVGSRAGAVTFAAAEVDALTPIAKKAVAAINLSGFPDLAHLQNYAKQHTGDQRYQFASDSIQELQNAYTSLLVRNGVRSDAAQHLSEGVINVNMGKRNIAGAFDAIEQSKNAILSSAPAARKAIMEDMVKANGGKVADVKPAIPEAYVQELIDHPEAAASFDKHFGEGASSAILSRGFSNE